MSLISAETMRAHRARWFGVVNDADGRTRFPLRRHDHYLGYDVVCSCGWDSATGGATRGSVRYALWSHRLDMQFDADRARERAGLPNPGKAPDAASR